MGDPSGQRLYFVDLDFGAPPSCPPALPFLPNSDQPKQNWADDGTTKAKPTKSSL